jgi:hypothetical protein
MKVFAEKIKVSIPGYSVGYWTLKHIIENSNIAIYVNQEYAHRFRTNEHKYNNLKMENKIEEF